MAHRIAVVGLTSRVAQYPYCPFQGVWSVILIFFDGLQHDLLVALGDLLDEFRKYGEKVGYQIPIVGDTRKKPDKFARIEALQPLFERGDIIFNELERDSQGMRVLVEQLLCFEKGSKIHDDAPDALEGAIWKLSNSVRKTNNRYAVGHRASRRW